MVSVNSYLRYKFLNAVTFMCCFRNYTFTQLHSRKNTHKQISVFYKCLFNTNNFKKNYVNNHIVISTSKIIFLRMLILFVSMSSFTNVSTTQSHPNVKYGVNTIKTKYGLLRGIVVRSSPLVEAYLGIPYASPPIGSLRFMPPITPSSWKHVRNADRFSPVCPQIVPIPPNGPEALLEVPRARLVQFRRILPLLGNQSEDCLYLNVYTPKTSTTENAQSNYKPRSNTTINSDEALNVDEKLSTVLFIHGESYEWNSGNPYDGSELAANGNVIVVTINFRLGILGFLKTGGKESAQGNFGLMDLVAGIHWLKENLPAFGGDANKITVMGHGTGAALANILLVSPVSSDLIQRAVLISGSALSPWAIQKSPLFVKRRVAEQTGCHGDVLYDDLAPCLRTKKLSELLAVKIDHPRFLTGFAPFVDGTVIAPNTDFIDLLKLPLGSAIVSSSGIEFANFPKQDLIFGLTSVESYLDLSAQDLEFGLNETRRDRILRTYVRNIFHFHLNEIFAVLKNEYTDWEKVVRNPFSSRDATLSFLSDGHTASPLIKVGYMHSLRGGRSFFLHFKHKSEEEEYQSRSGSVRGEDVPFWLGLPVSPLFPKNYSSQEQRLSSIMVKYLSNFVKTGNPNHSSNFLSKNNGKKETFLHNSEEQSKTPTANNSTTDNNLENDLFALPKRKRRVILSRAALIMNRQKRSNNQLKYTKFKRNTNKDQQGRNKKIYAYAYNKHTHLDEMINDDADKVNHNFEDVPYWEAYDSINQLYLEIGNKAEVHSHYRGHKLSMWLNLIPQLHKRSNINEISMRHHQFVEEGVQFYDGIIRDPFQSKYMDDEHDSSIKTNIKTSPPINTQINPSSFSKVDVTTDCGVNSTQFPSVVPPMVFNDSNIDTSPNVLENMNVLRRLSGKQPESYTTALVATFAVGCFLLVLNILIFAGIYHQRDKRAKDAKKKEQLEENEMFMTVTPRKNSISTTSGKVSLGEYNCFDKKSSEIIEKDGSVDNADIKRDSKWTCGTNTIDLLKIKCSNENLGVTPCTPMPTNDITLFKPSSEVRSLGTTYPIQTHAISYQDIDDFINIKCKDEVLDQTIPEPPPPPKSVHPNQGGILRISGTNQMNSSSKKRVHIQEISV